VAVSLIHSTAPMKPSRRAVSQTGVSSIG
jgi:hypothetical protein